MKFSTDRVDIFTTVPGAEVTIGQFGKATNTHPCSVPAEMAEELLEQEGLSTEPQVSDPVEPLKEFLEEPDETPKKARKGKER